MKETGRKAADAKEAELFERWTEQVVLRAY